MILPCPLTMLVLNGLHFTLSLFHSLLYVFFTTQILIQYFLAKLARMIKIYMYLKKKLHYIFSPKGVDNKRRLCLKDR